MQLQLSDALALAQLGVIALGVITGIAKLSKYAFEVGQVAANVENTLTRQNQILEGQSEEIKELRGDQRRHMEGLAGILTTIAVQDNRIDRIEADINDLKHGRGFVEPSDPNPPHSPRIPVRRQGQ